ncbi:uncharacterized protein LOC134311880 [Trichomycterus rosablanca]|uniref:uncharacterized protein LOC134311880 n=1 Tax=Trichomycterus rosablanca TaxID=2290929 RepID=UPI002F3538FF
MTDLSGQVRLRASPTFGVYEDHLFGGYPTMDDIPGTGKAKNKSKRQEQQKKEVDKRSDVVVQTKPSSDAVKSVLVDLISTEKVTTDQGGIMTASISEEAESLQEHQLMVVDNVPEKILLEGSQVDNDRLSMAELFIKHEATAEAKQDNALECSTPLSCTDMVSHEAPSDKYMENCVPPTLPEDDSADDDTIGLAYVLLLQLLAKIEKLHLLTAPDISQRAGELLSQFTTEFSLGSGLESSKDSSEALRNIFQTFYKDLLHKIGLMCLTGKVKNFQDSTVDEDLIRSLTRAVQQHRRPTAASSEQGHKKGWFNFLKSLKFKMTLKKSIRNKNVQSHLAAAADAKTEDRPSSEKRHPY